MTETNNDEAGDLAYTLVEIERAGFVPGSRAYAAKLLEAGYQKAGPDTSDGYHTFRQLYDHRRALTAALCRTLYEAWVIEGGPVCPVWRSRAHHPTESTIYEGYFIVGMALPYGLITYHYADQFWDDFSFVPVLPHAPKWDGANPDMCVTRMLSFARQDAELP